MTITYAKPDVTLTSLHPLEPLTAEEVTHAVSIIRAMPKIGQQIRFATVTLNEPAKSTVISFKSGDPIEREAFIVLLDNETGMTYEAVASLTRQSVLSCKPIPGVQPSIMLDEFMECEATVKACPEFQEALKRRGIANTDLVMVDPWSSGHYGVAKEEGLRLARGLCWLRTSPTDNGYARPIEGVTPVVDLNKMEVLWVEDYGVVPLPPKDGNYTPEFVKDYRTPPKPLEIVQPEGPSFEVNGHEIRWQKWHMRIGFTPREGLVLYTVGYEDQGRVRPILYRASLVEMTVPYGDPRPQHYRKNAFDVGEYGIGSLANSLRLGCDCLGLRHLVEACGLENRADGSAAIAPSSSFFHCDSWQLRVRVFLVFLPGRQHPIRNKADGNHEHLCGDARRTTQAWCADRAAALCACPPTYLQRADGHDD
jgi:primary-amine oxidase